MRKLTLVAAIMLLSFKAGQQVKTLKFAFTVDETQTILKGLSKLPFEESATIINKIQMTAQKQLTDTTKNENKK